MQVADAKGDSVLYPKVVLALPFTDSDNTYFFNDDYQVRCDGDFNDSGGGRVGACSLTVCLSSCLRPSTGAG